VKKKLCSGQANHPHETFNVSLQRRIQITEKTAVKIRFDASTFSTRSTSCATAAALVSVRRNLVSVAVFTGRSPTTSEIFEFVYFLRIGCFK